MSEPYVPRRLRCPVCEQPLVVTEAAAYCRQPDHYTTARCYDPPLGVLFGLPGRPWGLLADTRKHGLPQGWRDRIMGGVSYG